MKYFPYGEAVSSTRVLSPDEIEQGNSFQPHCPEKIPRRRETIKSEKGRSELNCIINRKRKFRGKIGRSVGLTDQSALTEPANDHASSYLRSNYAALWRFLGEDNDVSSSSRSLDIYYRRRNLIRLAASLERQSMASGLSM